MKQPITRILCVLLVASPAIAHAQQAGMTTLSRGGVNLSTGSVQACAPPADLAGAPTSMDALVLPPDGECAPASDPVLVIDASNGNVVFPMPDSKRQFIDLADFVTFAQTELNAQLMFDDSGALIGVTGTTVEIGRSAFIDPVTQTVLTVDNPIAAYIGGPSGTFSIGGVDAALPAQGSQSLSMDISPTPIGPSATTLSLDGTQTLAADGLLTLSTDLVGLTALTSSSIACTPDMHDCIWGRSWNSHFSFFLTYADVGSSTTQVRGGFQVHHYFCWLWGFIPWICTSTSGTNQLSISNVMFLPGLGVPVAAAGSGGPRVGFNVTDVTYRVWSIRFGPIMAAPLPERLIGVCAVHQSLTLGAGEATSTAADTYYVPACPSGFGVTASTSNLVANYQGCYVDAPTRALPFYFGNEQTIEGCVAGVKASGLPYAGLQYYGECWGGYGIAYTRVADAECNTPCHQNSAENCGGVWRNSIYSTR